ncbi:hypothetical protein Avbf_09189 [Armadillidium vulgare]|nr:hypothetical protein Avbf_09189 [Armadillidium vulgare]
MCYPREFRDINEARNVTQLEQNPFYKYIYCAQNTYDVSFVHLQIPLLRTRPLRTILQSLPYARLRDALATHPRTLRRPLTQEAADN